MEHEKSRFPARFSKDGDTWVVEVPLCGTAVRSRNVQEAWSTARALLRDFLRTQDALGFRIYPPEMLPPGEGWEWMDLEAPAREGGVG